MASSDQIQTLDAAVVSDPQILGGEPVIAGTRTSVRAVAGYWNHGVVAEHIPLHLSHLSVAQVFAALHYYLSHRKEIDDYVAANHIPEEWHGKRVDPKTGRLID
jgi:uncharacterized protein (DUF433 family)